MLPDCPVATHSERTDVFYCCCPPDPAMPQPGVHALVIGISKYKGNAFKLLRGSAPAATHFARFLLHDFKHPSDIPLRTLRMHLTPDEMLTEAQMAEYLLTEGKRCPPASSAALERALTDWAADCDAHSENVAILFVSGHGLATSSDARWAFLPEAGNAGDPYYFAINATRLKERMKPRRARTQIFIWDVCAAWADGDSPDTDGAGGLSVPYMKPRKEHPGAVEQVAIVSRLGTETFSKNAELGTVLSDALVGPNASEFRKRLMHTAVAVDSRGTIAVTTQEVLKRLPTTVGKKVTGDPGYVEHILEPKEADVGLNRPHPLPVFEVNLAWNGTPASDSLSITLRQGGEEVFPSTELIWTVGEEEITAPIDLFAGKYRFTAKPSSGDGNSYDVTVTSPMKINAWDGEVL